MTLICDSCGLFPIQAGLITDKHKAGDQCPCCYIPDRDCDGLLVEQTPGEKALLSLFASMGPEARKAVSEAVEATAKKFREMSPEEARRRICKAGYLTPILILNDGILVLND